MHLFIGQFYIHITPPLIEIIDERFFNKRSSEEKGPRLFDWNSLGASRLAVEIFPDRDPLWYDLSVKQPEIRDGYMLLPEGSGFGIDLNEDVIERWRVGIA